MNSLFGAIVVTTGNAMTLLAGLACFIDPETWAASAQPAAADRHPGVNPLAQDRDLWQELVREHKKIRRTVRHSEKDGAGLIETRTESDDPVVAAKLVKHAKAMQARMTTGARVRVWDPVFAELFERHDKVTMELTSSDKGITVVERSSDPETVALLRSHAMGVSEFVREGFRAAPRETPRFKVGDPLPPPELAIGGVSHRFLLTQPDAGQIAGLKAADVDVVINFRKPAEHADYDEKAAVSDAGISYCNFAYKEAPELTDELLDSARAAIKAADEKGDTAALHCRTGNRVGPAWAAYRAVDKGVPVEQAIAEAKATQMVDPMYESIVRGYIRRHIDGGGDCSGWVPTKPEALTPAQEAQRARAVEARDAMFSRLLGALGEAMNTAGPEGGLTGAIGVCKDQAPKVAQAVAREKGVMIGRTSMKLRNTGNIAPAWAQPLLADQPAEPRLAVNADGSLGVTLPIKLAANCLACHGSPEQIAPGVAKALAEKYPHDRATGFKEGDLRGWFWVEVPPAAGGGR